MVSTRHHPDDFPEPVLSPTKRSRSPSSSSLTHYSSRTSRTRVRAASTWAHTPSQLTLLWLLLSLPLVAWDTGYVLLRPRTMPGGALHWPLYVPYELYGRTDYVYGWKAFHARDGFPAAQATLNVIESVLYAYYLYLVLTYGRPARAVSKSAPKSVLESVLGRQTLVHGKVGGSAVILLFAASVMTLSKTVLYWLNEYFSGFSNIGHNTPIDLLLLWIIPNGLWIILPAYMTYASGLEMLQGLTIAAGGPAISFEDVAQVKLE